MAKRSVFTLGLRKLPEPLRHPILAHKTRKALVGLEGIIDIMTDPLGNTMLCFESYKSAERAQVSLMWKGITCESGVYRGELDTETGRVRVLDLADWAEE